MSLTVVGDACVDIITPFGDYVPGETHHRQVITRCGGTASVAVHLARLGGEAKFVGKVGSDLFGEYFRQNLKSNAVQDFVSEDRSHPTGVCISLVHDNGERTMVASRGANDYLQRDEVEGRLEEIVSAGAAYFSGYSLLYGETAATVLYLMEKCRENNCVVYFNPGAPNLMRADFPELIRRYADALILNMEEARILGGCDDVSGIAGALSYAVDLAVITAGEDGCMLARGGEYRRIATEKTKVTDTTGAGDAFSAGFIYGKLEGMTDEESAGVGNRAALSWLREAAVSHE